MRITHFATRRSFLRRSRFIGLAFVASAFIMVLAFANEARGAYGATNLVSDIPGAARRTDFNLVNPWGIAVGGSRFRSRDHCRGRR